MCDSVGLEKSCDSSALHISFTMVNFFIKQTIELIQQKKKKKTNLMRLTMVMLVSF